MEIAALAAARCLSARPSISMATARPTSRFSTRPTHPGAPDFSVKNSSNGAVQNISWGSVGDRAANADFDGDGKTDLAVFRPSEGNWYVLRSSDLAVIALHFGLAEDKAVPADFDGDGKADITVFRPSEGNWYSLRSLNGQFFAVHFGLSGDAPVQADYDGDGKADIAVFRPSEGNWYYLRSSDDQFFGQHFGLSGDRPVAGDYDGDGKADLALFRPSDRNWYILRSDQGFTAVNFGLGSDLPLQADLDGDGVRDIAVFRPSENNWYYLKSSDGGFAAGTFGSAGDTPVPSIYVGPVDAGDARSGFARTEPRSVQEHADFPLLLAFLDRERCLARKGAYAPGKGRIYRYSVSFSLKRKLRPGASVRFQIQNPKSKIQNRVSAPARAGGCASIPVPKRSPGTKALPACPSASARAKFPNPAWVSV